MTLHFFVCFIFFKLLFIVSIDLGEIGGREKGGRKLVWNERWREVGKRLYQGGV